MDTPFNILEEGLDTPCNGLVKSLVATSNVFEKRVDTPCYALGKSVDTLCNIL